MGASPSVHSPKYAAACLDLQLFIFPVMLQCGVTVRCANCVCKTNMSCCCCEDMTLTEFCERQMFILTSLRTCDLIFKFGVRISADEFWHVIS